MSLYGFAIRQSMGLPVILIKDLKTILTANIPEYEVLEYDESLRIDTVQNEIENLSEALKKVFANKPEPNSLLSQIKYWIRCSGIGNNSFHINYELTSPLSSTED
jgi:hypothetical protein